MSVKKPDVITSENSAPGQLSAWERWQLPNMDAETPVKGNAFNLRTKSVAGKAPAGTPPPEPEIKPPTAEEVEAIRRAAYEEGLQEGREAGKADGFKSGFKSGEAEIKAAITRLGQITRVLLEPIPPQDDELEQAVLQMVERVCKRVVHRELILDSSQVLTVVREALDCLHPGAQRIRIHLNPVDAELVLQGLRDAGEMEDGWRILPHATITPGGCIVETDTSMIDARAEKRLTSVLQQVYEQQHHALDDKSSQQGHMDQLLDEVESFDSSGDSATGPDVNDDSAS